MPWSIDEELELDKLPGSPGGAVAPMSAGLRGAVAGDGLTGANSPSDGPDGTSVASSAKLELSAFGDASGTMDQCNGGSTAVVTKMNARRLNAVKGEGAECSICFAPLPSEQVCVLIRHVYGKKRSCRHYFHRGCVQLLMRQTPAPHLCPLCRASFERAEALPDVRLDSRAWFHTVDADEGGALEKAEVVDALSATLPVDPEMLSNALDGDLWDQWDTERTGRITQEAFEHPARGLLHFVLYSLPSIRLEAGAGGASSAPVPDLVSCREGWFRYWDENCLHVLEFLQCLRALVRTLRLEGKKEDAGVLRAVLSRVWQEFGLMDTQAKELPERPVSLGLFCEKPDGFCDALVDALQKEFGAVKFRRMRQRAQLLQQPNAALKQELRKLHAPLHDAIEKDDLVEAILDAQEAPQAAESPPSPKSGQLFAEAAEGGSRGTAAVPSSSSSSGPSSAARRPPEETVLATLRALPLGELQRRLRAYSVQYGHCLERRELEELLAQQGDDGTSPLPTPSANAPRLQTSQPASGSPAAAQQHGAAATTASSPAAAMLGRSWNSSSGERSAGWRRPTREVPTVTEPPDDEDRGGGVSFRRCMKGPCVVQ